MLDPSPEIAALSDHQPAPEWDTSTAYDFCAVCGWPVRKATDAWHHEKRNLTPWVDRRSVTLEGGVS
jgi:hypothetical protein